MSSTSLIEFTEARTRGPAPAVRKRCSSRAAGPWQKKNPGEDHRGFDDAPPGSDRNRNSQELAV